MTLRYPLVANATSGTIQEIQSGDDLELGNADIANVGNINITGTANLGAVSNLTITGGSANSVLRTNGTGGVSWVQTPAVGNTTEVQFNNSGTLAGDAQFTYNSVTNTANIGNIVTPGTITSVGNVTGGNLISSGVLVLSTTQPGSAISGTIAIDSANNRIGVFYGGTWKYATLV